MMAVVVYGDVGNENCVQRKFEVISLIFFNVISFYLDDHLYRLHV